MANAFKPKRSATASKVPTTTELPSGELGVNMADKKIYINNGSAIVQVGSGNLSGLADVVLTSLAVGQTLQWDGTNWINVTPSTGGGGGGASVTVSDTAPSSPTADSLWWDSTVGQLRIWYNDGTSSQWVDAFNGQGIAGVNGADGVDGADGADGVDGRTLLNGTTNPTTQGADGDFYINTATNYIFGPKASGTWPAGISLVGGATVTTSDTAPSSPADNSLWFNSSIGQLFLWYNDGTSSQWVGFANNPGADGVGVPAGGSVGQFLKKNTGADYDTAWGNVVEVTATPIAGEFNNTATAPTNTNRLNYEGNFYATNLNGNLELSNIVATGTRDSTTFLRGDGTFAVPKGAVSTKETVYVTGSGTFTADPKALFTQVICTGGGGGGGGSDWTSGYGAAGGGGAGGTSSTWYTPAEMGATAAYAVGAAGTAGAASTGGTGGTGGASTFNPVGTGATLTGSGGVGGTGTGTTANTVATVFAGGAGGAASGGDLNREGANGDAGMAMSATFMVGGAGGMSYWGSGAKEVVRTTSGSTAGTTATSNGDGGSGACNSNNTSGVAGGAGAIGKIFIIEYLSA